MKIIDSGTVTPGRLWIAVALLAGIFLPPSAALAAQGRATIFGTVVDSSGAVVVGAKVDAVDVATQQARETISTGDGQFLLSDLTPGDYRLTVEASGFQTYVQQGLHLQVDENRQAMVQLVPGTVSQKVVVQASAAQIDTRTATIQEVVDAARVKELPLNGRNPLQLQYLVAGAGAIAVAGQAENESVSINGSRQNSNNYTLDGADNEDPFFNTPSVVPNPDALQEFSMQTSNYGAQEGRGAGAQMNAITKSGTNHLHGTLFEYLRNQAFDSAGYFATGVAPFHRNQFGGTVGGPIWRNHTFFFFAYQGTRERSVPGAQTMVLPSAAERTGNFSEITKQLKDPNTGKPVPGNIFPASDLNKASLAFLDTFVPLPNLPNNIYSFSASSVVNDDQYIGKLDTNISQKDLLSGRILHDSNYQNTPPTANDLPGFTAIINYENWNVGVNEVHTFSPHVLNQFTFGFNDIERVQLPVVPVQKTWGDLGAGIVRGAQSPIGYLTTVSSYFSASSRWPLTQFRHGFQYSDNLSWIFGAHSLSLGGDVRPATLTLTSDNLSDGGLTFAATYTGNQLSDFITGRLNAFKQDSYNGGHPSNVAPDLFAQDDWKLSPRLTVNLGLRWDPFMPYGENPNQVAQFRPGQQSTAYPKAPQGYVFPGDAGVPRNTYPAVWLNFAPRVGFAYDLRGNGRTSIRGGFGIYYSNIREQALNSLSLDQPYAVALNISRPTGGLNNPYSDSGNPFPFTPPATDAERAAYTFTVPLTTINDFDPHFRNARVDQWNLNVQQQVRDWIFTIAYVGSTGEHLFLQNEINPAVYGKPGKTTDARRVYAPYYSSITRYLSGGHSSYDALQLTASRRLSHGLTVLANYTWAKSIDNGSGDQDFPFNPFNPASNRGLSDFFIPQSFVTSFIWHIPNTAQRNLLSKALVNGWEVNGILTLQGGSPFSVVSGVDNSQSGIGADNADRIGNPQLAGNRSHAAQIAKYFNTAAYKVNAPGTFGDSGRNSQLGPGIENFDFGLIKMLPSPERYRVQFRAETFNLLNHTNLAQPTASVSSSSFGRITAQSGDPRVMQLALRFEF